MDQFTPELMRIVYEFLPWKERMVTRRLSCKFRSLLSYPISLSELEIRQDDDSLSFILKPELGSNEPMEIVEIRVVRILETEYSKVTREKDGRQIRIMTVFCNWAPSFCFIETYMNLFVSVSSFRVLKLINLQAIFLDRFHRIFNRSHRDFDWKKEQLRIDFCTCNNAIAPEERKFLNNCKYLLGFTFCTDSSFTVPSDFWELAAVSEAKELMIKFGAATLDYNLYAPDTDINLGMDNELIKKLVKRRLKAFTTNSASTVTPPYLKEYIRSCLNGGYGLFKLLFLHNFDQVERDDLRRFLSSSGFDNNADAYVYNINNDENEKDHPDQMIVNIHPRWILIQMDTAFHRRNIQ